MAKIFSDYIKDIALNEIKNNSTELVFCSAECINFADVSGATLATILVTSADFTGPIDDLISGRKLTVNSRPDVVPIADGTILYVILTDGVRILAETTTTSQVVISGQTWSFSSFDISIYDPV